MGYGGGLGLTDNRILGEVRHETADLQNRAGLSAAKTVGWVRRPKDHLWLMEGAWGVGE